jgi:hypothetical protein
MNEMRKLMEAVAGNSFAEDNVIAQAGEFKVVSAPEGMVHIIDGEQAIRVSMFRYEWDDLIASYDNGDYIDEAEDMLAVDPAVKASLGQDAQDNVWSVWFGDETGEEGYLAKNLSKDKALAVLKLQVQEILDSWSEEAYVTHTPGRNIWTVKDPQYQTYIHYELQKFADGMRDWSAG